MSTPTRHLRARDFRAAILSALLLAPAVSGARAADLSADNLTIQQSAYFGSIFTDWAATTTAEGLRVDTVQDVAENFYSSTIPGYYVDNWVTVEDYGTVQQGRWETAYSYQVVSQNWVPGDYDSEGNEISPAHYEDVWDYVPTGSNWVDESYWGVVGTHQENQATWVPEQTTSWTEYSAGVPRVRFTATRSDTNFVFRVPSPGSGSDGMKDILVIWEGGLSLPSTDPSRMSVFMTDALQHTLDQGANSYTSRSSAELLDQRGNSYYSQNGVSHYDQSHSELRPSLLKLTRTESANGVATIAQTQIAAKSASFAGVVNVDGNLSVKGVIRVQPAGDLTMGPYTNGPQP